MGFLAKTMLWGEYPPVKAYIHSEGLELYENDIYTAKEHLAKVLSKQRDELRDFDYVLAIVWGDTKSNAKMMDIFGFILDEWPGDPDVWIKSICNGEFSEIESNFRQIANDDLTLILGNESKHRVDTPNLDTYAKTFPKIIVDGEEYTIEEI